MTAPAGGAGRAGVEIEGLARFQATWDRAVDQIQDYTEPNRQTADLIQARARTRAPRRTGALAASIQRSVDEQQADVGSNLVYAPVQHFGWPAHHIRARPFLYEAAESVLGVHERLYLAHLNRALSKVKGA